MPNDVKKKILDVLKKHPEGLTFLDIAKFVGLHRHTVTKYIYELTGEKKIIQRKVGPATLCYIYRDNFLKGQNNLVAGAMIFTILISALVLVQTLGGFDNFSITGFATADQLITEVADEETSSEALEGTEAQETTTIEDTTSVDTTIETTTSVDTTTEQTTTTVEMNETTIEETTTSVDTTTTQETSTTIEMNETTTVETTTTIETTSTIEINETTIGPQPLQIELIYPEKILRGKKTELSAIVTNSNTFSLVAFVDWHMPEGLYITSKQTCNVLQSGGYCYENITVQASLGTELGIKNIKAVVSYEA